METSSCRQAENQIQKTRYSMLSFIFCSWKTVISRLGQTMVMGCVLMSLVAVNPYLNPVTGNSHAPKVQTSQDLRTL